MTEEVSTIIVTDVKEHEDGSATYTFDIDKASSKKITELGLELVLTCAAYGLDIHEALAHIAWLGKSNELNEKGDDNA